MVRYDIKQKCKSCMITLKNKLYHLCKVKNTNLKLINYFKTINWHKNSILNKN